MERCWGDFYKLVLGPLAKLEDSYHPSGCSMFQCRHDQDKRIRSEAEKMQMWDDFVFHNYKAPQVGGSIEASLKFA